MRVLYDIMLIYNKHLAEIVDDKVGKKELLGRIKVALKEYYDALATMN